MIPSTMLSPARQPAVPRTARRPQRVQRVDNGAAAAVAPDTVRCPQAPDVTCSVPRRTRSQSRDAAVGSISPEAVTVYPMRATDLPMIALHARGDAQVQQYLMNLQPHQDPASMRRYIAQQRAQGGELYTLAYNDIPIGMVEFSPRRSRSLKLDYMFTGAEYRGRGITKVAMSTLYRHLLIQRGFRKINLKVHTSNIASLRLQRSLGARQTGSNRSGAFLKFEVRGDELAAPSR